MMQESIAQRRAVILKKMSHSAIKKALKVKEYLSIKTTTPKDMVL